MAGTSCIAVAPVPITATRLPSNLISPDHSAECSVWPLKFSSPLKWAGEGSLSWPIALTSAVDSNVSSPFLVLSVEIQRRFASSQCDATSSVFSRTCLRMSYSLTTFSR